MSSEQIMQSSTISLSRKKGSLFGSILLICGSSIGVGILPLPVISGQAGSLPTCLVFIMCCIYMTITALLLLEVSCLSSDNANFITLSNRTLNKAGKYAISLSFIFLFYSLTTAYLSKGGELIDQILSDVLKMPFPHWTGAVFLAFLSGMLIFMGPRVVDYLNRIFMVGFFATYLFLNTSGIKYFKINNIAHSDWNLCVFIIPFIITSFGYHNLVPTISNYLKKDRKKSYLTFIFSAFILFFIYVIWVVGLQGIIPLHGEISLTNSFTKGEIVTQPLAHLIHSPMIQFGALYMAIFAIITSVLGQGLSIIDFLSEILKVEKNNLTRLLLCLLLFVPTLISSQMIPGVFFKALEFAGGIAAMVIFGVIPGLMGWVIRYRRPELNGIFKPLVRGGKPMLVMVIAFASFVILYELIKNI